MARIANQTLVRDARLKRLAESIDALAEKDEGFLRRAREITALRQAAAADLSKALTLARVVLQHIYFHSSKHCEDCVCARHIAMRTEEFLVNSGIGSL